MVKGKSEMKCYCAAHADHANGHKSLLKRAADAQLQPPVGREKRTTAGQPPRNDGTNKYGVSIVDLM